MDCSIYINFTNEQIIENLLIFALISIINVPLVHFIETFIDICGI